MLSTHHFGLQTVQASYISWHSRTYSLLNHSHVHLLGRAEHKNQEQHGFWSSCTRPQAWTTSIFFIMWGSKALKWHDLCEGFEFGFVFPYIQPNAINAVTWKHPINCPGPPGIFLENTHICVLTQICIYSHTLACNHIHTFHNHMHIFKKMHTCTVNTHVLMHTYTCKHLNIHTQIYNKYTHGYMHTVLHTHTRTDNHTYTQTYFPLKTYSEKCKGLDQMLAQVLAVPVTNHMTFLTLKLLILLQALTHHTTVTCKDRKASGERLSKAWRALLNHVIVYNNVSFSRGWFFFTKPFSVVGTSGNTFYR